MNSMSDRCNVTAFLQTRACAASDRRARILAIISGVGLIVTSTVIRAEVSCPGMLDVTQRAAPPSADWQVSYLDRPARLIGASVYDGMPTDRKVRPTSQRSAGGTLTIRWRLRENRRSYYLLCSYEHTTARLYAALPPGVLSCEAAIDLNVAALGGHPVKRMFCR